MSRLTENNEFFKNVLPKVNAVGDTNLEEYYLSIGEYTTKPYFVGKAVDKLSALEDVLEEFGIESAEELRLLLNGKEKMKTMSIKGVEKLKQENKQLKEQLSKAIVPKFEIGQECWGVVPKTFWNNNGYIIQFKVKAYIPDNNGIMLMLEDRITNLHYSYEWQVFATKSEAEQKLKELEEKK